ncbi:hypothetical protein H4219_003861 [Mycoemilia scoparia]|uniref:Uncharacterized protein n=1 Tax=Mycoemilia scoparia TaxID=417184 RepID=A0A9W8DMA1_9FUNG|nr:hypothetical protein H4219_003861 [Mycoemilia scoparia]
MQVKRLKSPSNAAIPATIKQVEKLKEELRDSVSDQRRYEIWKEVYDTAESYSIKLSRPEPPQPRPQPQSAAAVSQASSILDQLLAMATSAGTPVAAQTITQIPTQAPSGTAPVTAAPQQPAVDIMALFDSLQSIGTFNNTNNTASNMMGGVQVSSTATAAPVPAPNAYGVYPATTASSAVTTAATIATATPPPPVVLSGGISGAPAIPIISSQPGGLVPPISLSRSDIKK